MSMANKEMSENDPAIILKSAAKNNQKSEFCRFLQYIIRFIQITNQIWHALDNAKRICKKTGDLNFVFPIKGFLQEVCNNETVINI